MKLILLILSILITVEFIPDNAYTAGSPPPAPSPLSISPSTKDVFYVNQSIKFTASGGTTPYSFSTNIGSIDNSGNYRAPASAGNASIKVTDKKGNTATYNVPVYFYLTINPTSSSVPTSSNYSFSGSGGLGPYKFSTTNGSIGSNGVFSAPGSAGSAVITVTDSRNNRATSNVTIYQSLGITPTSALVMVGKTITFRGTGGYGSYSYSTTNGSIASNGIFTAPGSAGSAVITVTDSRGARATASVTIYPSLAINPTSKIMAVNGSTTFTASGGYGNRSFSRTQGTGTIGSANGVFQAPSMAGSAVVTVADTLGNTASANITINADLIISPTSKNVAINQPASFSATGGVAPLSFSSSYGNINSSSGAYTAPGTGGLGTITVTDSSTPKLTKTASVCVFAPLTIFPVEKTVTIGKSISFSASEGCKPYSFSVTNGIGSIVANTGVYTAPSTAPSNKAIIRVTDAAGNTASANITINANLALEPPPLTLPINGNYNLMPSGGVPPYTFEVTNGVGTINSSGKYTAPGSEGTANITVTDGDGIKRTGTICVYEPLQISPKEKSIHINSSISFTASHGCKPYKFSTDKGSINIDSGAYTSSSSPGLGTVTVSDLAGKSAVANITIYPMITLSPLTYKLQVGKTLTFTASGGIPAHSWTSSFGTITSGPSINPLSVEGITDVKSTGNYTAPNTPGSAIITVSDSDNHNQTANIEIYTPLEINPVDKTLAVNDTFSFAAKGGVPPYTFSTDIVGAGIVTLGSAGNFTAPSSSGVGKVIVKDSLNNQVSATVTINPALSISPTLANLEVNKSLPFVASGGIGPYIFSGSFDGTRDFDGNGNFRPIKSGKATITLKDSANHLVTAIVNVFDPLEIIPSDKVLAVGDSFDRFTARGGIPGYSFNQNIGLVDAISGIYTAPLGAPGTGFVEVKDSIGNTKQAQITINPALSLGPQTADVEIGKNLKFTGSGGIGDLTFTTSAGRGQIDSNGNYIAPSTPGPATITLTDKAGHSKSVTINIYNPLIISPQQKVLVLGDGFQFNISGGVLPYTVSAISGQIDLLGYYTSKLVGSDTITVIDKIGNKVTASVTINPVLSVNPTLANLEVNKVLSFVVSGGIGPYSYGSSMDARDFDLNGNFRPIKSGRANLTFTDSTGRFVTAVVNVYDPLNISPNAKDLAVGNKLPFLITGGALPYKEIKAARGVIDSFGNYTAPSEVGDGKDLVTVKDTENNIVTASLNIKAALRIDPSSATLAVNRTVVFKGIDGVGPYTFSVKNNIGSVGFTTGSYQAPASSGTAEVTVRDSLGNTATAIVTINPDLDINPKNIILAVGKTRPFSASGGVGDLTFSASSGIMDPTTGSFTAPNSVGEVTITVTDSAGFSKNTKVTIYDTLKISPALIDLAINDKFKFTITGGYFSNDKMVHVLAGRGTIDENGNYTAPATVGSGEDQVTVKDSDGNIVTAKVVIRSALSITPALANLEIRKTLNFTASGGVGDLSLKTDLGSITPEGLYTAPGSVGSGLATITVTDEGGHSATAKVNIYDTLRISPTQKELAVSDPFKFTITGGFSKLTVSAGRGTIDENGNYVAPSDVGSGEDTITVKDSDNNVVTAKVTINSALSISPSTANLEVNKKLNFTVAGGIAPYTYVSSIGTIASNKSVYNTIGYYTAPATKGTATITVTDNVGHKITAEVNVYDTLAISPTNKILAVGNQFNFTASGGVGPYTFGFETKIGEIVTDGNLGKYTAPSEESGTGVITLTDSIGNVVKANIGINTSLAVRAPASLPINEDLNFKSITTGGIPDYSFSANLGTIDSNGIYKAPASGGLAEITVTDSDGVKKTVSVCIFAPLAISPDSKTLALGDTNTFEAQEGCKPYKFEVTNGEFNVADGAVSGSFKATNKGLATIKVTDNVGHQSTANITINAALSISPSTANLEVNKKLDFTASGGVGTLTFEVSKGEIGSDGKFTAPDTKGEVTVTVRDGAGHSDTAKVNVYDSLKISPIQKDLAIGDSVDFIIEGGLGPYVSIEAKNGSIDANRKYTASVEGDGSVIVEDSAGNKVTANIKITSALSLTPNLADVEVGKSKQFSASGGVGELSFTTVTGRGQIDPAGNYTAPGTVGPDTVTVTDKAGHSLTASINVYQSLKITPAQKNLAVGDTVDFVIEGGLGSYTIIPAGGSIDASRKYTALTAGSGSVIVTDAAGNTVTANITISPALSLDPILAKVEVGKTLKFNAAGGVGDLSFNAVVGRGQIDSSGNYRAPATLGPDTITVSDTANHSLTAEITVYESLRITPEQKDLAVGNQFKFEIVGGLAPYTVVKAEKGTIDLAGNYVAPATAGDGKDKITVTDSDNNSVTATLNIKPALRIDPSSATLAVNRTKTFNAYDGVGPYTFSVNNIGSIGLTTGSYQAPATSGAAEVTVRDSLGNTAKAMVTINPELIINPENINLAVNGSKKFNGTGGVGDLTFSISQGTGSIAPDGTFTAPSSKGLVQITVTDSEGFKKTANVNVYLPLNIDPTEKILAVGNKFDFRSIEGVPPYVFSVDSTIGSITTSNLTTINAGIASLIAAGSSLPAVGYITLKDTANPDNQVKAKVTVNAALSIDPKPSFLAAGGTYDFGASTKGGAPGFTYSATAGSIGPDGKYTAPNSNGTAEISVKDSMGAEQKVTLCIYSQLEFDPNQDKTLAVGNSYTFKAKDVGCKPYKYAVNIGTIGSDSGTFSSAITGSGVITVTDATNTNTAHINVTINPALTISPALANIEVQKTKDFTASGGVPPYNITLLTTGKGSLNSSTGPVTTFTAPATSGSNTVRVTDSFGNTKDAPVTIYGSLVISPDVKQNIEVGKPAISFTASGGVPNYIFSLSNPVGTISSSGATASFNPGATKGVTKVVLTDAENNKKEVEINVYASLILSPSANQNISTGAKLTFTASEGLPGYSWSVSPAGATLTPSGDKLSAEFTAPSTISQMTTFTVTVTDSANTSRSTTVGVVPPVTISPTEKTLAVQGNATFTASGGTGSYNFTSTIGSIDSEGIFSALNNPGTGTVTATDKVLSNLSASANITIIPKFSLSPSVASVEVGKTYIFVVSGGVSPFTFVVDNNMGSVVLSGTNLTYTAPSTAGAYVIRGTDNLGNTALANVTVYAGLGITPPSKNLAKNATATFTATGGTAPYTWTADHGSITPSGTGNVNGNYSFSEFVLTANVTVTDSKGKTATAIITGDFPGTFIWASGYKEINKGGSTSGDTTGGPGARGGSSSWADNNGNIYIQGGVGWGLGDPTANTTTIMLYYLWKYDTKTFKWTAIKQGPQYGYYGSSSQTPPFMDSDDSSNSNDTWTSPGGRVGATTWTDKNGQILWLFGGKGYGNKQDSNVPGSTSDVGYLNDLWRYEIATGNWTWVKGARIPNQKGITTAGSTATPGARYRTTRWIDPSGNLWLFGGYGYSSSGGNPGYLNDVWKFTPTATSPYGNWEYVSGSHAQVNVATVYGGSGSPPDPGGRYGMTSWVDSNGKFWLFGGSYTSAGTEPPNSFLNDLWKYDPADPSNRWTLKNRQGDSSINQPGVYGTNGVAGTTNTPGSRDRAVGFTDSKGNLWMFGGYGYGKSGGIGYLNDLWRINILSTSPQWVWERGSDSTGASMTSGNWGTLGTAADTNIPDARNAPISWQDSNGTFWFFGGGQARDEIGKKPSEVFYHNDLWKFFPE